MGRLFAIRMAPSVAWVLVFLLAPASVLFAYSFGSADFLHISFGLSLHNYVDSVSGSLYRTLIWRSLWIGGLSGLFCAAVAFPLVYSMTVGSLRRHGDLILLLVIVSLFSAYIVRVYAARTVLGRYGLINTGLEAVGVIDNPLSFLLYTPFAVIVTMVNVNLPLAVLPLYASMSSIDRQLIEASRTLGASPLQTLRHVTLPLSARGLQAGFALCFIISAGDFVTPQLVGGRSAELIGNIIQQTFGLSYNWPLGAALAFILVVCICVVIAGFVWLCRALGIRERPA